MLRTDAEEAIPEPGTLYCCGCYRKGDPSLHPFKCLLHDKVWQVRREPEPVSFVDRLVGALRDR